MKAEVHHDCQDTAIKNKLALHSKLSSREASESTHFIHFYWTQVNKKSCALFTRSYLSTDLNCSKNITGKNCISAIYFEEKNAL